MKKIGPYLLLLVSLMLFPWCIERIFLGTPIEAEMGTAQKIFYFHVPQAWICMLFALISGGGALVQLRKNCEKAEAVAQAAAELCVVAGAGVLITGPIWGDATWGTPWTGDARQTTTALLWLSFVAYLLLRNYGPSNANRLAAGLAIFGAADVFLIYYAVKIWRTTHPTTEVTGSLPPSMRMALYPSLFAFLGLSLALFWLRLRQLRQANALDQAWIRFDEGQEDEHGEPAR